MDIVGGINMGDMHDISNYFPSHDHCNYRRGYKCGCSNV